MIGPIKKGEILYIAYTPTLNSSMALDVYYYEERLPFKCLCPLSVQHRKNERIIKELIDSKRTTLPDFIKKDPFYRHRCFYCRNCLNRKEKTSNWMILHSSQYFYFLKLRYREAYVCLQCFAIFRKNSSEYAHIRQSVNTLFDSFLIRHNQNITMADCVVVCSSLF